MPPVAAIDAASLPNVPVHQLTTFHVASPPADTLSQLTACCDWATTACNSVKLEDFMQDLLCFVVQVELSSGNVTDRYTIENDCVDLANNNGACLYDNLLAILTVGHNYRSIM